jgi:aspartyl-tRNA(Asn)/glutamyl-tRNA(Gln) amidotransferase subunit A
MYELMTLKQAADALANKTVTSVELTQSYLDRIRAKDGDIHAYLEVFEAHALEQAKASDARRAAGSALSEIDGIPLAIKDNMLIEGEHVTGGSKILDGYVAPYDATVTQKLKDAGAIFLGRVNMDEFAMGGSTERSAYGITRNPVDLERVPGGSSGGSAAAVAGDLCIAALGSDTGGSIRQPAAFTGIVGLKPSYGTVSRYGLMAMASSLDQIGPMTKTVEDAALLYQIIRGEDYHDQTTVNTPPFHFEKRTDLKGIRVGIPKQAWGEGMTDGVRQECGKALETLKELGAEMVEIDLPYMDEALAVYYVLMPCEVSANISRFDGIRYGQRAQGLPLIETYGQSRLQGLGEEVRRRVMLGTYALSRGYYDAYYRKARKVQTLIRRAYNKAFEGVDVIVTPTTPSPAFKIGEKINDPLAMYLEDVYTVGVNVAGIPAVSVPCGKTNGLPVGLQFIGGMFKDDQLLSIASAFESAP